MQFLKRHATENLEAERMEQLRALANTNPAGFSKARAAYQDGLKNRVQVTSLRTLYNPLGRRIRLRREEF